jgi:signal transduction histidine kinase
MSQAEHRRQITLFVAAVVLPSAVLVALGFRMMAQERQLAASRVEDDRRRVAAEVRQSLLVELDRVERDGLESLTDKDGPADRRPSDASLAFVAPVVDGRIVLPWEADPNVGSARSALTERTFEKAIRRAEVIELRDQNIPAAVRAYRAVIGTATHDSQEALGRLLLARALTSGGEVGAAEQEYRALLAQPSVVVDEHGIPFAWYAVASLIRLEGESGSARDRLAEDLASAEWRSPTALHMLSDLVDLARVSAPDSADRPGIDRADRLAAELRLVERVQALQVELPFLLRTGEREGPGGEKGWTAFADGDWLVLLAGLDDVAPEALVAADVAAVFQQARESNPDLDQLTGPFEIRYGLDSDVEPLGASLAGFGLSFSDPPQSAMARQIGSRNSLYLLALTVVVGITLFGGYLLMRDIRREMRVVRMRTDFVSSVSHELKTPLTAIRMFAETLKIRDPSEPEVQAEYLDTIVGESERLTRLLNNVLDASKIERGQKSYRPEPTSLAEIAERATRALEYPLRRDGFQLNVILENGLPPVSVDGDAIEQVVLNLLTNAMKYSGASREIDLRLRRDDGCAVIDVTDHGVGIPEEATGRVTEKFFRVPSPENERIPGSGLGLTIVAHAVRAHGGHMELQSEPGKGSTFSIHLPLMESEETL